MLDIMQFITQNKTTVCLSWAKADYRLHFR